MNVGIPLLFLFSLVLPSLGGFTQSTKYNVMSFLQNKKYMDTSQDQCLPKSTSCDTAGYMVRYRQAGSTGWTEEILKREQVNFAILDELETEGVFEVQVKRLKKESAQCLTVERYEYLPHKACDTYRFLFTHFHALYYTNVQLNSRELVKALNEVKMNGNEKKGSSIRFYLFIAFFITIIAYLVALFNRESVCNLLRTNQNEYFISN